MPFHRIISGEWYLCRIYVNSLRQSASARQALERRKGCRCRYRSERERQGH